MIKDKTIGDTLDDALADQDRLEATEEQAIKVAMAKRMNTSRREFDRLLEPIYPGVTWHTLQCAPAAVGWRLRMDLVKASRLRRASLVLRYPTPGTYH